MPGPSGSTIGRSEEELDSYGCQREPTTQAGNGVRTSATSAETPEGGLDGNQTEYGLGLSWMASTVGPPIATLVLLMNRGPLFARRDAKQYMV